jgi:hypothetical protein
MQESYLVKIGASLYLTKTGLVGGQRMKFTAPDVWALQFTNKKRLFEDFKGNTVAQLTNVGTKGRLIAFSGIVIPSAVASSLAALIETAENAASTITVIMTHSVLTDYTLTVIPGEPAFTFEDARTNGDLINWNLRFITVA